MNKNQKNQSKAATGASLKLKRRTPQNKRRSTPLSSSQLRWMDQFLRSFSRETPEDWLPYRYKTVYRHDGSKKPTLH
jgi:hypothetical protein